MSNNNKLKILFVAGGTGGHILPAVSFGDWIRENNLPAEVGYLCGSRELERKIYKALHVDPVMLPLSGSPFGVKGVRSILRWKEFISSLVKAHKLIKEIKPSVIVLFGGYLSVPFALLFFLNVPMIAHEQNAIAGKATRLCSRRRIPIVTGWDECLYLDKKSFMPVGVPVRRINLTARQKAWELLGGKGVVPSKIFVLVMGGSIGGKPLMQIITEVAECNSLKDHIFMLVGTNEKSGMQWLSSNVVTMPPSWDLSAHFSLAHYAVTRCGASTLSELICYDVPGVLIPWEGASDDHQLANAKLFLRSGKGRIWRESENIELLEAALLEVSDMRKSCNDGGCDVKRNDICARFWNAILSFSTKGEGSIECA